MLMFNGTGKDSFWLQLEVCREFQRSRCTRTNDECKFAHPPKNVEIQSNGRVTACYDSIKGRCTRDSCKYLHPPDHLKDQLITNGRNHLAFKNALIQHQQHAVVSAAATAAVHLQQADPRSSHHLHQHHAQLHQNQHQNQNNLHLSHSHHNQQQQQAALFQSAVAAAAAQHQQHHHEQHYHQQAVAAAFNRAAAVAAAAAAAASANSCSSISPNSNHNNHHTVNNNSSSHLNKPQQQVIASQYDLSTQQLPTALAPVIAAFSLNPFMTPNSFGPARNYAANQYAAAIAAAASQAAPTSSIHQSSANHETTMKSPLNSNCQSESFVAKSSGATKSQLSTSSGGIIKASPTHYTHQRGLAAAANATAPASISPTVSGADPLSAAYYINPASIAASTAMQQPAMFLPRPPPVSGCDSTSDQQQAQVAAAAAAAAQVHYQAVLSAALTNYGQMQPRAPQSQKSPPNYAQATRAPQSSATTAKVSPVNQPNEDKKQTCDSEKLSNVQGEDSIGDRQQLKADKEEHQDAHRQIDMSSVAEQKIKSSKCKSLDHNGVEGEHDEDDGSSYDSRPAKRPHLDLSSSSWLSPASSSGSNTNSDATRSNTPSSGSGHRTASLSSSSPGHSTMPDKQQQQLSATGSTDINQPLGELTNESDESTRQQQKTGADPPLGLLEISRTSPQNNGLPKQSSVARSSSCIQVEICREFLRNACRRTEQECRFAHPPHHVLKARLQAGSNNKCADYVTVCMDFLKGRCARSCSKCRYLHPVAHLQYQLISGLQLQKQPIQAMGTAFALDVSSSFSRPLSLTRTARAQH